MKNSTLLLAILVLTVLSVLLIGCACDTISTQGVTLVDAREDCENDNDPNHCYKRLAKKSLNPLICEFITKDGTKGKCLIEVAKSINDPGICKGVGGYYTQEQCYYELALEMRDASLCMNIGETYVHRGDDISGQFTREDCLGKTSGKTREKLCGFVDGPCCAGYRCENSGCTVNYRCGLCGQQNMPCCMGFIDLTSPAAGCGTGLRCSDDGVCLPQKTDTKDPDV